MFGFGNNKDEERMWNFTLFNFYGTDKEFEDAAPTIVITLVLVVIVWAIWFMCN